MSWQEPLLFKTSGSQTPLSREHFVAQHSRATSVSELPSQREHRTPQRRELEGPAGPGEHKSVVSGATAAPTVGEGAPSGPHGDLRVSAPCLVLAMLRLLPSPREARKGWGAGPAGAPHPRTRPQISNKNKHLAQPGLVPTGTRDPVSRLGLRHLQGAHLHTP